jgi:hypothetical protein
VLLDCANAVTVLTIGMFVPTILKEVVSGRVVKKALSFIKNYFLNNQPNALIIQIYSVIKLYIVSGIFFAHHQEFSTWAKKMLETCRVL